MKAILSLLFAFSAPFLLGGLYPVIAYKFFGFSGETMVCIYLAYTIIWFYMWLGPLEEGRKLSLF